MELTDIIQEDGSPDLDVLGVYCDWLSDQDRDAEAEALRFLYRFQHWPSLDSSRDGIVVWWFFSHKKLYVDRYGKYFFLPTDDETLSWWRATLPTLSEIRVHHFKTILEALQFYLGLATGQLNVLREAALHNERYWDEWMRHLAEMKVEEAPV